MPNKPWKTIERKVCRVLGGERNPLSGICGRHTAGDCINTEEFVEIKHRAKLPAETLFKETKEKAKKEGKRPIVVLHKKGSQEYIVMLSLDDYIKLKTK